MKVSDLKTGKVQAEMLIYENKAKIRYEEEEWLELPREQIGSMSESFHPLRRV